MTDRALARSADASLPFLALPAAPVPVTVTAGREDGP